MYLDIGTIFQVAKIAQSLASYFKIVETVGDKIDKLTGAEYDAGTRALRQAYNSENERKHLLREARVNFNKALSFEEGERLALTYLGLSFCHFHLKDFKNSDEALIAITDMNFNQQDFASIMADQFLELTSDYPVLLLSPPVLSTRFAVKTLRPFLKEATKQRLKNIHDLQAAIKKYLEAKKAL